MERKFTDQQMALILKRAADRQAGDGDASHSLESIQEIAREVGIDPGVVAEVAATLDVSRAETTLFGASSAYRSSRRIVSHASTIDHAAILAAIREHLPLAGEKRDVGDGIEWHSGPADNKTVVVMGRELRWSRGLLGLVCRGPRHVEPPRAKSETTDARAERCACGAARLRGIRRVMRTTQPLPLAPDT